MVTSDTVGYISEATPYSPTCHKHPPGSYGIRLRFSPYIQQVRLSCFISCICSCSCLTLAPAPARPSVHPVHTRIFSHSSRWPFPEISPTTGLRPENLLSPSTANAPNREPPDREPPCSCGRYAAYLTRTENQPPPYVRPSPSYTNPSPAKHCPSTNATPRSLPARRRTPSPPRTAFSVFHPQTSPPPTS